MDIFYSKKRRINLHRSGSVELYLDINYFRRQIDVVVTDSFGEERFLPTDFGSAISRYKELCQTYKEQKGHRNA